MGPMPWRGAGEPTSTMVAKSIRDLSVPPAALARPAVSPDVLSPLLLIPGWLKSFSAWPTIANAVTEPSRVALTFEVMLLEEFAPAPERKPNALATISVSAVARCDADMLKADDAGPPITSTIAPRPIVALVVALS